MQAASRPLLCLVSNPTSRLLGHPIFYLLYACMRFHALRLNSFIFGTLALYPTVMSFVLTLLGQLALLVPILLFSHLVWFYVQSPLKHIPGPFLARFTNIWRLMIQMTGRSHRTQSRLHERHGSAVRLGPNLVSLSDPSLIKVVYDARGNFVKVRQFILSSPSLPHAQNVT